MTASVFAGKLGYTRCMTGRGLFLPCDLCGAQNPRFVLESARLDGPLVECTNCHFRYVGRRTLGLAFGNESSERTAEKVSKANAGYRHLPLQEEKRLAALNAKWRLDLIRTAKPSGNLLEIGCARGDFMQVARNHFDV